MSRLGGQLWKPGAQAPSVVGGKTFTPAAHYPGSSKSDYTICEVSDGTVSCNCMGWTRRNPPGGRTCKHTQDYVQFLQPLWQTGGWQPPKAEVVKAFSPGEAQAGAKERGGSLAALMAKMDKAEG